MDFPDTMIDLETTGTDASHAAIIQISAVRFNFETGAIDPNIFDGYLTMAPGRFWDEDTRTWWYSTNKDLFAEIQSKGQDPGGVFRAFADWAWQAGGAGQRLWAKPVSFEWPFIQSYAREFNVTLPFHFRDAVDLNSFCRGVAHDPGARPFEKSLEFQGTEHNAIDDVMHQIRAALLVRHMVRPAA